MTQFQISYGHNGVSNIFELYLFINPLGYPCYKSQVEVLKMIEMLASEVDLHILPLLNQKIIERFMAQRGLDQRDLQMRNNLFQTIYKASIAYKSACIQGKRIGREFLFELQRTSMSEFLSMDEEKLYEVAHKVGLDFETFLSDYRSDFTRQLFLKDQQIANELLVELSPSVVIFEYFSGEGRLVTDNILTCDNILEEINSLIEETVEREEQRPHLKLI